MSSGPRPRSPVRVVVMVVGYWVVGNILQVTLAGSLFNAGLLDEETAGWAGLVLGWGVLFVISLVYREQLDRWLRS